MSVTFVIPGKPGAKGRPKFARHGNAVLAYTPAKTASYENLVKLAATAAVSGAKPSAAPIDLVIVLSLQIPASWSNKRRALAAQAEGGERN